MADEIGQVYRGMMVAVPAEEWAIFGQMEQSEYVAFLKRLAGKVDLTRYPKAKQRAKKAKPKRKYDPAHPHVSVAKILLPENSRRAAKID